jgi:hypothetical protein
VFRCYQNSNTLRGTAWKNIGLMYLFFTKKLPIRSYECNEILTVTKPSICLYHQLLLDINLIEESVPNLQVAHYFNVSTHFRR